MHIILRLSLVVCRPMWWVFRRLTLRTAGILVVRRLLIGPSNALQRVTLRIMVALRNLLVVLWVRNLLLARN